MVTFQTALKTSTVKGLPFMIYTDPGNICNLRCPLCPTGADRQGRPRGMMEFKIDKVLVTVTKRPLLDLFIRDLLKLGFIKPTQDVRSIYALDTYPWLLLD